jgi:hypothetical protein
MAEMKTQGDLCLELGVSTVVAVGTGATAEYMYSLAGLRELNTKLGVPLEEFVQLPLAITFPDSGSSGLKLASDVLEACAGVETSSFFDLLRKFSDAPQICTEIMTRGDLTDLQNLAFGVIIALLTGTWFVRSDLKRYEAYQKKIAGISEEAPEAPTV